MSLKFVCDLRLHEDLQTKIVRQIRKENEEIEKIETYTQKPLKLCTNQYVCF